MKGLEELRRELDAVDRELVHLFERRMTIAGQVAACKIAEGRPVLDRTREEAVRKMKAALCELVMEGLETNTEEQLDIVSSQEFMSGAYDLTFMEGR